MASASFSSKRNGAVDDDDNDDDNNNDTTTVIKTTPDYSQLLPKGQLDKTVRQWLDDDMPSFDVGGFVVGSQVKSARLLLKSSGIFAGKPFFDSIFTQLNCQVTWKDVAVEGTYFNVNDDDHSTTTTTTNKLICLAKVTGPVNALLQGERTALNTLSRCSGVATAARNAQQVANRLDWKGYLAGTRKTTPGFRIAEKYGLLVGGVATHRLDLSQMVMLKDNHIWSMATKSTTTNTTGGGGGGGCSSSITDAIQLAKRATGFSQKLEVECQSLQEALEAAQAGADIVMLDNLDPEQLKKDAAVIKGRYPSVLIEASGGITLETLPLYTCQHVDIISQGKLTQGYDCLDYSLKIIP